MQKLTVVIHAHDDRLHLASCVESIRPLAHEILIADYGSRDGTREIAQQLEGCQLIELPDCGPIDIQQRAISHVRYEWVLLLLACERVTPELTVELRGLLAASPALSTYSVRRESYFLGYPVPHCHWHEPYPLRLLNRRALRLQWAKPPSPSSRDAQNRGERSGRLRSPLLHYAAVDLDRFLARQQRDATWAALDAHDAGKCTTWLKTAARGPLHFLRRFVLGGGFRDGRAGLMVCGIQAYYAFLRDCKLWELQFSRARFDSPRRFELRYVPPPAAAAFERDVH
jgi:(heptosyl)LPS beta-1,4-glucosyltransferase